MKKIFIVLLGSFLSIHCFAQLRLGLFGGIANYQGDLVDKVFQSPKAVAGLTLGYDLSNHITLRAGFSLAKIAGADSLNKKDLRLRNLSFQSRITEFSLIGEFNAFDLNTKSWSPYIFTGLAIYHYNPYSFDQSGNKVFLRPLSTEGEGLPGYLKSYSLTQLAIPFGAGVKFNVNEKLRLAFELGLRKLFTDYLDDASGNYADPMDLLKLKGQKSVDLSYRGDEIPEGNPSYPLKGEQRGSPKYKDFYYFTGVHLSILLPEGKGHRHTFGAKKSGYGCPTVF